MILRILSIVSFVCNNVSRGDEKTGGFLLRSIGSTFFIMEVRGKGNKEKDKAAGRIIVKNTIISI